MPLVLSYPSNCLHQLLSDLNEDIIGKEKRGEAFTFLIYSALPLIKFVKSSQKESLIVKKLSQIVIIFFISFD